MMGRSVRVAVCLAGVAAAWTWGSAERACAQLPFARIDGVFPPSARLASETEVVLSGPELENAAELIFDTEKIVATKLGPRKFRLTVAADCAPGLHDLRAIGPTGISTPRAFLTDQLPEALDAGDNHAPDKAQIIEAPGAVSGVFEADAVDRYRFAAKAGRRLALACIAQAIDSPANPTLLVRDVAHREIARAMNTRDRDAFLEFTPAADGEYFAEVYDHLFAGGPQHIYRLSITDAPETNSWRLRTPASATIPDTIDAPAVAEIEPNDTPAQAQKIPIPCVINGPNLDRDWFEFQAEKGRPLRMELVSDRADWPSDPLLVLYKVTRTPEGAEQMKQVAEFDDQADFPGPPWWRLGSRDPVGRFVPDETAAYRLVATDRLHRSAPLRLIIQEEAADFALLALAESPANEDKKIFTHQPVLRRGGAVFFHLAVRRRGYEGAIETRVEGLPAGVTASGLIEAGQSAGILAFHAAPDAPPWSGPMRVFGMGGGVEREARGVTYRWNPGDIDNVRMDARICGLAMGVVGEAAPLGVQVAETKVWEATIGQQLEIPLTISRGAGAKGVWQLKALGFAGMVKPATQTFDGGAAAEAKLALHFANQEGNAFQPGLHTFFIRALGVVSCKVEGEAQPKDRKHQEITAPITVQLAAPPPPAPAAP